MAELQINKRYVNEAELGGDLFRQTNFYSDKALDAAFSTGYAFNLGKMAFENRDKDLSSIGISMNDYKYLSGLGQMTALETAFNEDVAKDYKARADNLEYLKAEIQQGKNQEIYENQNWFVKTLATVGTTIANVGVELYGTLEGLLDAGATLINFIANDKSIQEWVDTDKTGYKAAKAALEDFNSKYTDIGHGGFGDFIGGAMYNLGGIAGALLPAAIPGGQGIAASRIGLQLGAKALTKATAKAGLRAASRLGRTSYWVSMTGHTAYQATDYALKNDLDISGTQMGLYTAAVFGVEFATERLGGKLFGGSAIDRMVLGKLATPASKWGSKLSTKSTLGAIAYRAFGDVLGEATEEMIAELGDSLLYSSMITGNPDDVASFNDIMYAGFLGGVMGGLIGGVRTARTNEIAITRKGAIVQANQLTEEQQKDAVVLTKAQSVLVGDALARVNERLAKEIDYVAQSREGRIIEANAKELTEKQNQKLIKTAAGLGNFFANIGDEEFKKSVDLLTGTVEQQAQAIRNFANRNNIETKIYKEIVEQFNKTHPRQSIDVVDNPTIEAKRIQQYIQDNFGVNVLILKTGAQDGVNVVKDGVTINEYTIGFREDALKDLGTKGVLNQIIAHELAHTLAFAGNVLTPANLLQVKRALDDMGIKTTKVGKSLKVNTTELSEAQADAIAELLIFDDSVVEKILFNERNIFIKTFNWMKDFAKYLNDPDRRKKKKNIELYKALVKRMSAYRKIAARAIGNEEDLNKFVKDMSLTEIEIKELADTYLPTWRTENCSITKYNLNLETLNKMEAVNLLMSMRKDKNDEMFDFSRAFDPEYYSVDFINDIVENIPNTPFKEAIQTFVFGETGYIISNDGWVIDGKNVIDSLNEDFVNDLINGKLLTREGQAKYPTLHQLLDKNTQALFVGSDGSSATAVKVVFKDSVDDKSFDADYNYVTKTLTLTLPRTNVQNKARRSGFEEQLKRCMAMAIADVHSFYGGLVPLVVQQSLNKMPEASLNKIAKQVLTDEFLATQPSRQNVIDMMIYKITELTTTQRTLDDVTSGFITNGMSVQGYGDFYGISFSIAGVPTSEQISKTLRAINDEFLTVAFKTSNKKYFEENKYDPTKTVPGQQKFEVTDKEITNKTNVISEQEAKEYKKQLSKRKTNKPQQEKPKEIKTEKPKEEIKQEPKEETVKAPNQRAKNVVERIKKFEFSDRYQSQVQRMDSVKEEDKNFAVGARQEFAAAFAEDLTKMTDEDVLYYIDVYNDTKPSEWTTSSEKAFMLLFEYINHFNYMFNKRTKEAVQKFLMARLNASASGLSTFGHMFTEAHPLLGIERQLLQEGIVFKIPQAMKDRWIDAARSGDIKTQTEVEMRVKDMTRDMMHKFPRRFNWAEKGITREERRTRVKNFIDRFNAYRYLAMLSNPATHVRNIVSNVGIRALTRAAEGFEVFFNKFVVYDENDLKYLPDQKVTKEDIAYVNDRFGLILDSVSKAGKYDNRTRTDAAHIVDNLNTEEIFGNSKIFKWLQTLIYDKSLSKMDTKISRPELARVLTQLLVANFPKQFEYDKANYKKQVGVLFDKIRPFENLVEEYEVESEKQEDNLIAQRKIYEDESKTKEAKEISDKLDALSKKNIYISQHIDSIGVEDVDFLKQLLATNTEQEAKDLMGDYRKTHKDVEKIQRVKGEIQAANKLMEENGLTADDLKTLFDVATRKVLTNYLRYENRIFKAWCKLMDTSVVMRALGSVFLPFAKVATNMTLLIYQYSPINLLRGIVNMSMYAKGKRQLPDIKMDYTTTWHNIYTKLRFGVDDARFLKAQSAEDVAKGTLGTLLLIFGVILNELGIIEKDDDDEKYGGYVLHLWDAKLKLSDVAPAITPLITGAALAAGAKKGGFGGALNDYWEQVSNDTLYGSFNNIFELSGDNILDKTKSAWQTYVTQYVPAFLRALQKVTDNKVAINYQDNWFSVTGQKILSAIPGLSRLLPNKIDPYTGDIDRAYNYNWGSFFNYLALLNMVSPISVSADKNDAVRELAKQYDAKTTGSSGKLTINDKSYDLKGAEKQTLQTNRANYANMLLTDFMNDKTKVRVQQEDGSYKELTYSQMTNEEKKTAINSYYSKATNYAKIKYWINSGHKYVTPSRDEYETLRKLGINVTYRVNSKGSKYKD